MRTTLVLIAILFMAGCASAPVYMGVEKGIATENASVLDGKCDKSCKDIIKAAFLEKFPDKGINISQVILVSVNGKYGPYTFIDKRGSYNNSWDGALAIVTLNPGEHSFEAMPNHYLATRSVQSDFSLNLQKGHQYFFGGIIVDDGKIFGHNPSFEWCPLVFDKTTNQIVYPFSDIETKHQEVKTIFIMI